MERLPFVLLQLIDSRLNLFDHLTLKSVCKKFQRLGENYRKLWETYKLGKYIPQDVRFLKYLIKYHRFNDMSILCKGSIDCVILYVSKVPFNPNEGLKYACRHSNIQIARLMIQYGANNFNEGFRYACWYSNIQIVRLMIEHGANSWDSGLRLACFSGNLEIVCLMIEKGANDWNGGLKNACGAGHHEITQLMTQKGADNCTCCLKTHY